ncbi:MAG: hypothetical protein IPH74_06355 [Bacteroidetes bacterium]|nr:hypothetical protein [Bacteroidota bacterium]
MVFYQQQIASLPPPQNNKLLESHSNFAKESTTKPIWHKMSQLISSHLPTVFLQIRILFRVTIQLSAFTKIENTFKLDEEI